MKRIVVLSLIGSSFLLAENIVNDLEIEQINKVRSNSTFSNSTMVSQGQTVIENNSNVEDVHILQKTGNNAGNLIEETTLSDTEVNQGFTMVNSSTLHHVELDSDNTIRRVNTSEGTSLISQAALIVGGDSNASGTAGTSGGGYGGIGGTTGENIEITEDNLLEDTEIKASVIHQGLTQIKNGADVLSTFKLNQTNTITVVNATGNDINASTLTQGETNIDGGTTTNIEQKIKNVMEDITVDGSTVQQSSMNFASSDVSDINNNNSESDWDDRNRVTNTTVLNGSVIDQSSINVDGSTIDGLYKYETDGLPENNWIHTVTIDNATIKQSSLTATNGSNVVNVTYKKENMGEIYSAPNLVYDSKALNQSKFLQDVSTLDNGDITDTTFNRGNSINVVNADNSIVKQFNVTVDNSSLSSSNLRASSIIGGVNFNNAVMSQGSTIITD
jgi:hypothetical protein